MRRVSLTRINDFGDEVSTLVQERFALRLIGRSYMAFVLTPEGNCAEWLAGLDSWLARSRGFFAGRPVVLDLAQVKLDTEAIASLIAALGERAIRVMGVEGVDGDLGPAFPPLLRGGKQSAADHGEPNESPFHLPKPPPSLLVDNHVRSGQSVVFAEGDITVLGSVGSGAEIVAGGSIHIYGTLRGRAMAGIAGNASARIFCQKIEAELLAIDGFYRTAEEIDATLRARPAQAWLDGSQMRIAALN